VVYTENCHAVVPGHTRAIEAARILLRWGIPRSQACAVQIGGTVGYPGPRRTSSTARRVWYEAPTSFPGGGFNFFARDAVAQWKALRTSGGVIVAQEGEVMGSNICRRDGFNGLRSLRHDAACAEERVAREEDWGEWVFRLVRGAHVAVTPSEPSHLGPPTSDTSSASSMHRLTWHEGSRWQWATAVGLGLARGGARWARMAFHDPSSFLFFSFYLLFSFLYF
jgi:hypothetical protein